MTMLNSAAIFRACCFSKTLLGANQEAILSWSIFCSCFIYCSFLFTGCCLMWYFCASLLKLFVPTFSSLNLHVWRPFYISSELLILSGFTTDSVNNIQWLQANMFSMDFLASSLDNLTLLTNIFFNCWSVCRCIHSSIQRSKSMLSLELLFINSHHCFIQKRNGNMQVKPHMLT